MKLVPEGTADHIVQYSTVYSVHCTLLYDHIGVERNHSNKFLFWKIRPLIRNCILYFKEVRFKFAKICYHCTL